MHAWISERCVYTMSSWHRQDLVRGLWIDMGMCVCMCANEAYDARVPCVNVCIYNEFMISTRLSS